MRRDNIHAAASPRPKQPNGGHTHDRDRLGIAICTRCTAVHRDKRWTSEPRLHARLRAEHGVERTTCPACLMQQHGLIEGVIKVHAGWTPMQRDEAVALARNEEQREAEKNGLHRIVSLEFTDQGLELTTTTEFLARHLSRRLERTFAGHRAIKQSPGEKFVEIVVTVS